MSDSLKSIYNIREDEVKIEGKAWDDDEVQKLVAKKIYQIKKMADYNEFLIDRGTSLYDQYEGDILTQEQRDVYELVEDKIVIEPPIMKSPIRALVGQAMKGRRSGQVTTEGGSYENPAASADESAVISLVMKDLELKTKEKYKVRDAIHDTMVAAYPTVLYFDKRGPTETNGEGKLSLSHLPWDSVLCGPLKSKEVDGSDKREMAWFEHYTQAELEANWPDMVDQIRAHIEDGEGEADGSLLSSIKEWEGTETSETRNSIYNIVEAALGSLTNVNGFVPVCQHLFPIIRKEDVWVNMMSGDEMDYIMRSPDWDDEKWEKYLADNPKYQGPYERSVVTLWMCVFTLSGLMLACEKHWFQEGGRLPASIWTAAIHRGRPTAPTVDMSPDAIANAVAEIEYLDDLRKGGGVLGVFKEGAMANPDTIPEEASKSFGVAFVSKDFPGPVSEAFSEIRRQPNQNWKTYAEGRKTGMEENTRLNEAVQGGSAPRQAAIAKQLEITQALVVNAIYIDNVNMCWESHQNLKLSMLPYGYDEYQVLQVHDEETNEDKVVSINEPEGHDLEGLPTGIINDVSSKRYKWRLNPVDDSATAKQQYMNEAAVVMNSSAGPLIDADPSGKFFARFLQALPNPFLNDAGKALAKDAQISGEQQSQAQQQQVMHDAQVELMKAQADMIRAEKEGKSFSITGEQLATYPNLFGVLAQMGMIQQPQGAEQVA
jgi:hypothetical protein